MKRIIEFTSSQKHYDSDGAVFYCFDWRLVRWDNPAEGLLLKFIQFLGLKKPDVVMVAGGAMEFRSPNSEGYRFLLGQALASCELHNTKTIHIVVHVGCGKYKKAGLLSAVIDQALFLSRDLLSMKPRLKLDLKKAGYKPEIFTYLADFEGMWEV